MVDRKRFKKTQAIKITTKPTTTAVTVPFALIKIPKETISNWERINNTPPIVSIKTDTIGTKQVMINLKILSKRAKRWQRVQASVSSIPVVLVLSSESPQGTKGPSQMAWVENGKMDSIKMIIKRFFFIGFIIQKLELKI